MHANVRAGNILKDKLSQDQCATYFFLVRRVPQLVPSQACMLSHLLHRFHSCLPWHCSQVVDHSLLPANINTTVRRRAKLQQTCSGFWNFIYYVILLILRVGLILSKHILPFRILKAQRYFHDFNDEPQQLIY